MIEIKRFEGETDEELLLRVGGLKESQNLSWEEVRDIMNRLTNSEYTESKWRKQYTTFLKMFNANQETLVGEEYSEQLQFQIAELQKAKYQFYDQRNAYNKILRERARQEELNEIILSAVKSKNIASLNYVPHNIAPSDNDMLISLCDPHYGADIDNAWNKYNSLICKERLNSYLDHIKMVKKIMNSQDAIVWCNGDLISGAIHRSIQVTNKENVIEQVMGIAELIADFLSELSVLFGKVRFCLVSGNHSRLDTKDNSLKDERMDDLVEWYLKARLQNFKNIIFDDYEKIDTTLYVVNVRGLNYAGCHGDYDEGITKILTLQVMSNKNIYGVLSAHLHHNKTDTVQGIKTIMAGSFQGMDDYCVQKRIYGVPEQIVTCVGDKGIICHFPVEFE